VRFITKTIHAYLDYPVAFALMVLPFMLYTRRSNQDASGIIKRTSRPERVACPRWHGDPTVM
jgi:hypothetical protein